MNIPNSLTIARIFFVPMLVAVLVQERIALHWNGAIITNDIVALIIFWLAAATDLLDGYLARRWKQVTTLGMLLDPIADKLLVSSALIALVQMHVVAGWLVVLLIGREFAVTGLRGIAAAEGYTISASELGKTKTLFQVIAISLLMIGIHHPAFSRWATLSLGLVVFFSVWSAISYFTKFWRKVDVGIKHRRRAGLLIAERQRRRALFAEKRAAMLARRQALEYRPREYQTGESPRAARSAQADFSPRAADLPPSA